MQDVTIPIQVDAQSALAELARLKADRTTMGYLHYLRAYSYTLTRLPMDPMNSPHLPEDVESATHNAAAAALGVHDASERNGIQGAAAVAARVAALLKNTAG